MHSDNKQFPNIQKQTKFRPTEKLVSMAEYFTDKKMYFDWMYELVLDAVWRCDVKTVEELATELIHQDDVPLFYCAELNFWMAGVEICLQRVADVSLAWRWQVIWLTGPRNLPQHPTLCLCYCNYIIRDLNTYGHTLVEAIALDNKAQRAFEAFLHRVDH
jgi:hypothetical protein